MSLVSRITEVVKKAIFLIVLTSFVVIINPNATTAGKNIINESISELILQS